MSSEDLKKGKNSWSERATPTPAATPIRAAGSSRELNSIRAEAEVREAEVRGNRFDADVARIKAYYEPRISAAKQAGDTQLANKLIELYQKEFKQALGRKILEGR
jgi:hypothetical protein